MRPLICGTALGAVLLLFACGGGGSGSPTAIDARTSRPLPIRTRLRMTWSRRRSPRLALGLAAPIVDVGGRRYVGADVEPTGTLSAAGAHADVLRCPTERSATVPAARRSCPTCRHTWKLRRSWGPGFDGLPIHRVMPTVRLLEGTSEQDREAADPCVAGHQHRAAGRQEVAAGRYARSLVGTRNAVRRRMVPGTSGRCDSR